MDYQRPWKSFEEQLVILKSRGMVVNDDDAALTYLERVGYYRLSAYWYPFRKFNIQQNANTGAMAYTRSDELADNTQFVDAIRLYLFDKKLRLLVMDALERIEVAVRVDIAYLLGERDTFAYKNINEFHPSFARKRNRHSNKTAFDSWQTKYASLLNRSKEDFVNHYRQKHGADLPIWVAVEIWDFGAVSQLFAMMKVADKQKIAEKYGVSYFQVFESWLRALNYLRNITAHHSRLWNRNIIDQPKLPTLGKIDWCDGFIGQADLIAKPFLLLAIVNHFMKIICPATQWNNRVAAHINSFPELHSDKQITASDMGLVDEWEAWW